MLRREGGIEAIGIIQLREKGLGVAMIGAARQRVPEQGAGVVITSALGALPGEGHGGITIAGGGRIAQGRGDRSVGKQIQRRLVFVERLLVVAFGIILVSLGDGVLRLVHPLHAAVDFPLGNSRERAPPEPPPVPAKAVRRSECKNESEQGRLGVVW